MYSGLLQIWLWHPGTLLSLLLSLIFLSREFWIEGRRLDRFLSLKTESITYDRARGAHTRTRRRTSRPCPSPTARRRWRAPELIAPPPMIIWLPNDLAGVARSKAVDLQKYHDLRVTLDMRMLGL
ncbi:hypothetical protein B0H13DRAFT_766617 [Mycena leptocephala]|nr:hypothetical protein B0H13DRAFT_766617 [Mycena leptocephala]